jgi:hypothetical protein
MSFSLLFILIFAVVLYWAVTQVLPERKRTSLLRPGLADGILSVVNEKRLKRDLHLLDWDEGLIEVAENKAAHQVMTENEAEGWDYPPEYEGMLGRSLLVEALYQGPFDIVLDQVKRTRDMCDADWLSCGIGVAGKPNGDVVVAVILCREAWEVATESVPGASLGGTQSIITGHR